MVGDAFQLAGSYSPVRADMRDEMEGKAMSGARAAEVLLTGQFQPDTSAADLGTKISVQWFVQSVVLIAKAAADPGLDHLDLPPGKAKRLRDDPPQHVGHLGAGYDDELLVLHIGVRDGVLHVTVLDRRHMVPFVDADQTGFPNRCVVISFFTMIAAHDIIRAFGMHRDCAGLYGLLRRKDGGVFFLFHLNQAERLPGR